MALSKYYADGYKDGKLGIQCTPPPPYSFSGHTTNVYANEYLQGWQQGQCEERALMFADRQREDSEHSQI
jgi:hypothetical protein